MVAVKIWGGLGNQMFQYTFALYLAKARNDSAYFFTDAKDKNLDDFAIKNFNLILHEIPDTALKTIGYSFKNTLHYRLVRKSLQILPFLNRKLLVERGLHYKENINQNTILFDGYWQSFRYIDSIEKELREKFIFKDNDLKGLLFYEQIQSSNAISLHIRKGDYLQGKNLLIYEPCPLAYYQAAINLMKLKVKSPVFFVFSNDLNWAKENLKVDDNIEIRFVNNSNYNDPAISDMFLMSKCKHHIIANSTFSWWAAWLNSYKNKIIIAPLKWYIGNLNKVTVDLIPANWIRI